jgi:hypothetical protein
MLCISAGSSGGRIEGSHRASIDLPEPGGSEMVAARGRDFERGSPSPGL